MLIPPILGNLSCEDFFIFAACDGFYFDEFGRSLINSIQYNSSHDIHIHLFNPTYEQIDFCHNKKVSVSYEYVPQHLFFEAAEQWTKETSDPKHNLRRLRILTAMEKGKDRLIIERIEKTYYASARFIRLAELTKVPKKFLAIDSDAIVRKNIQLLDNSYDFYIHQITGPKARFLAGGIYSSGNLNSYRFLNEYAGVLKENIENNYIYWSMDQDLLDDIVPKYKFNSLPLSYIDWNMSLESNIWTAKGKRKEVRQFIAEQKKYSF